jgi:uncharacterized protein (DUF983 family)
MCGAAGARRSTADPVQDRGAFATAVSGLCPRCGAPGLFDGPIRFAPKCKSCGLDYAAFNVGDGAAAFLILIVGAVLTVGAIVVELKYSAPWWVHLVWVPIGIALTLAGLRLGKALLLGQEFRTAAREGRIV